MHLSIIMAAIEGPKKGTARIEAKNAAHTMTYTPGLYAPYRCTSTIFIEGGTQKTDIVTSTPEKAYRFFEELGPFSLLGWTAQAVAL